MQKISVFDYVDYRTYLKDYFFSNKKNKAQSLEAICRRASELTKSHLSLIIHGKRNLTATKRLKLLDALGLTGVDRDYLDRLIQANQAKSLEEKAIHLNSLSHMRPLSQTALPFKAYSLLEKWHGLAIRELARLPAFDSNPKIISRLLRNRLSLMEASRSVDILTHLGLLRRTNGSELKPTDETLVTHDEISSPAIRRYHLSCMELARRSLDEDAVEEREFASVNVVVSAQTHQLIKKKIKAFRDEIATLAANHIDEKDHLYQLNLQFFRLSEVPEKMSEE